MARRFAPIVMLLALGACGGDDGDDTLATSDVADAVDSVSELARLVVPLQPGADLAPLTGAAALLRALQDADAAFHALVDDLGCLTITSTDLGTIDVAFASCRVGLLFRLDGTLHAGLAIETDAGGRPTALAIQVSTPKLVMTGPLRTRTLSGTFALRHAIPLGDAVTFSGQLGFVSPSGEALSLAGDATWQVTGDCVTFDGGGQLTGGAIGPAALAGHGVTSCRDACATAGDIELSYGGGTLLDWTYDGRDVADVAGPHGKTLTVPLVCTGS